MPEPLNPEQIRTRYLSDLRNLYRLIARLEQIYPDPHFPDAPADTWRAAISSVAAYVKTDSASLLVDMGGSHMALRNLVADSMGIEKYDGQGSTYGHRVLDINWS